MILARCIRQFERDGEVVQLAKDFVLACTPTLGCQIAVAGEANPFTIVSITLHPRPVTAGALPPGVVVEFGWEQFTAAAVARERGWEPVA